MTPIVLRPGKTPESQNYLGLKFTKFYWYEGEWVHGGEHWAIRADPPPALENNAKLSLTTVG